MTIQGIPTPGPGLRLHLNENSGGCSPRVVEAVRAFDAARLSTYPDYRAAVHETAAFLGVDPDRVILTNGLDEGLLLIAIAYLGHRAPAALVEAGALAVVPSGQPEVIAPAPTFEPVITSAKVMGARIVSIPAAPDYVFAEQAVLRAITPNTRIVYLNTPNNPTGQLIPKAAIRRVAEAAGHAVVVVDEAYHDFAGENFLDEAANYPNVIVGRTFSKAHGLAGIRVGVVIGAPAILEAVRTITPIFNLNVVAVAALRAAVSDPEFMPWYVDEVRVAKERLYAALDRVGLHYWRSAGNFVLVRAGDRTRALVDGLLARQVLVRDRSHDPSCPGCFRITAGTIADTDRAIAALEELCAKP